MKITLEEKGKWLRLYSLVIPYLSLPYIKKILLFYDFTSVEVLSSFIIYGGIIILIGFLCFGYYLNKKYKTPSSEILSDKQLLILHIIIIILGVGNNII